MANSRAVNTAEAPGQTATPGIWDTAAVLSTLAAGTVEVRAGLGEPEMAVLATHVPMPVPGQTVLLARPPAAPPLVMAVYGTSVPREPCDAGTASSTEQQLFTFDPRTGVLSIHAQRIQLEGVDRIELRCADAVLRLTAQGELMSQAQSITQAAIGPHRIEGASVDIN